MNTIAGRESPFRTATGMENALTDMGDYEATLRLVAASEDGIENWQKSATRLMADALGRVLEDLGERHITLFRALHPDRDRFEREGWPSDRQPTVEGGER